jgi:hypothetical protein
VLTLWRGSVARTCARGRRAGVSGKGYLSTGKGRYRAAWPQRPSSEANRSTSAIVRNLTVLCAYYLERTQIVSQPPRARSWRTPMPAPSSGPPRPSLPASFCASRSVRHAGRSPEVGTALRAVVGVGGWRRRRSTRRPTRWIVRCLACGSCRPFLGAVASGRLDLAFPTARGWVGSGPVRVGRAVCEAGRSGIARCRRGAG